MRASVCMYASARGILFCVVRFFSFFGLRVSRSRDPLQKKIIIIRSLAPRKGERNARALDDTVSLRKTSERERTFITYPSLLPLPPLPPPPRRFLVIERACRTLSLFNRKIKPA